MFWLINDQSLFGDLPDCVSMLYDDVHDFDRVEVTRRIGIRTQGCNGTKVECIATGDSVPNPRSAPAFLYLVCKSYEMISLRMFKFCLYCIS